MENLQVDRLERYFRRIAGRYPPTAGTASLLITHLVDDRPVFIAATAEATDLRAVLPKPRSVQPDVLAQTEKIAVCDPLSRELFAEQDTALAYLEQRAAGTDLVLADVGGYFAPALAGLCARFSGRIAAVIEDTENGLQRYLGLDKVPCPVFSVARSPLKVPEDFLVGQSVVFSVESLIRGHGDILACRPAAVIGFGKIGASTAALLHAKGLPVTVFDADPVKRTQALAHGYAVTRKRAEAIAGAGIVVCATGNLALRAEDFAALRNGAYLASVTSSDDELELAPLAGLYRRTQVAPHVTRYDTTGHYFYLLADGNAVNFVHGASAGAFIYLVQAEILAAIGLATAADHEPGIHDVPQQARRFIAETWLECFAQGRQP